MKARQSLALVKQAASSWVRDRAPSMGAALSYYTVFSIAPLLLIVIAVAGLVFGADAAREAIVGQLQGLLGEKAAQTIQDVLKSVSEPKEGILATVIGVALLLVGATTVFAELQDDLDRIWKAPERAKPSGLWGWMRSRILSFGVILALGFLLLVSLAASAAIAALGEWWGPIFAGWEILAQVVNFVVSFALITVMFAVIYRFMPHVRLQWHDVWIGAAVTALLFTVGKQLIGMYIGKSDVASGFGAAGSLAILLLWVYYSAQVFLLGAEFTRVYAQTYGSLQDQPATKLQAESRAPPQAPLAAGSPTTGDRAAAATPGLAVAKSAGTPASSVTTKAGNLVQRHVMAAMGVAAALGALAALALKRRRQAQGAVAASTRKGRTAAARSPQRAEPITLGQAALEMSKSVAKGVAKGAVTAAMHSTAAAVSRGAKRGMASPST